MVQDHPISFNLVPSTKHTMTKMLVRNEFCSIQYNYKKKPMPPSISMSKWSLKCLKLPGITIADTLHFARIARIFFLEISICGKCLTSSFQSFSSYRHFSLLLPSINLSLKNKDCTFPAKYRANKKCSHCKLHYCTYQ